MTVAHRSGTIAERQAGASDSRPVMLVTFDVPVRTDAATVAVDSAVESGQALLLVNMVDLPIRPMKALLELVGERQPGLLVLGADATRMRRRKYHKAARTIRESASCLVWIPAE